MRKGIIVSGVSAAAIALALAIAALGLRGGVAHAQSAGTPTEVGVFGCIVGLDGHRTVAAGSTIVIRNGWQTSKVGSAYAFLGAEQSILSVNDGQMVDVSGEYAPPEPDSVFGWSTWLRYPTGVTLAAPGDTMRFTFTLLFDRPLTDLSDLDGDGTPDPVGARAGLAFGGTCTVTAV